MMITIILITTIKAILTNKKQNINTIVSMSQWQDRNTGEQTDKTHVSTRTHVKLKLAYSYLITNKINLSYLYILITL